MCLIGFRLARIGCGQARVLMPDLTSHEAPHVKLVGVAVGYGFNPLRGWQCVGKSVNVF